MANKMIFFCVMLTFICGLNSQCTDEQCCNSEADQSACASLGCIPNPHAAEGCVYDPSSEDCRCFYIDYTPSPTEKPPSKESNGYGDCICTGKMVELRFIYSGDIEPVQIIIDYKKDGGEPVCIFDDVMIDDEVTCNIYDYVGDPIREEYNKDTGFFIIDPSDGSEICGDSFHTSCSRDIIGTTADSCDVFTATGWKDTRSITYPDDEYDCDDGYQQCSCGDTFTPVVPDPTTTYIPDSVIDTIIGETCYCKSDVTPSPTEVSSKSKSKSKSKDKGGLGIGDCDCDGGMVELRLVYSGVDTVNVQFNDKNGNELCLIEDTVQGNEVSCNVLTDYLDVNNEPILEKLTTNTYIILYDSSSADDEVCRTTIHTSCSRDIVGLNGDDSSCGDDIVVTGWKDGSDDTNDCDDGLVPCNCENGTTIIVPDTEESVIVYEEDPFDGYTECYCSNINATAHINSIDDLLNYTDTQSQTSSKSKSKSRSKDGKSSLGFGECDCKDGINLLRLINVAQNVITNLRILYEDNGDILCEYDDVQPGKEIECDIADTVDGNGEPVYEKYDKNTYFEITTSSGTCYGAVHTSCSKDIIGWTPEGCPELMVSGWQDNAGGKDCDDGFEPCDCDESFPCDTYVNFCDDAPDAATEGGYCCPSEDGCEYCEVAANSNYYNIVNIMATIIFLVLIFI